MIEKLESLKRGEKVEVYDKNLIFHLQEQVGRIICAKQCESHFKIWIPGNLEFQYAYKHYCRSRELNESNSKVLKKYLKEVRIIWKKQD